MWDHPLGARFEEPDAVCVFDDVLIPWDRVFLYGDVKMGNALFAQASDPQPHRPSDRDPRARQDASS